jgi:hypothetical protein
MTLYFLIRIIKHLRYGSLIIKKKKKKTLIYEKKNKDKKKVENYFIIRGLYVIK